MAQFILEDILSADKAFRRNLINSATGFKSVTLIGSQNEKGTTNLAIFSQIIHLGADPPLIGILFRPHVVQRDTLENICKSGFFTINHFNSSAYRKAHHTSARWSDSEFESCGFSTEYFANFKAPFVEKAPVQIGLSFQEKIDIGINGTHMVIGRIELLRVDDQSISSDGFIDLESLDVVTCSGLDSYHTTKKLSRLSYAKVDHSPTDIE